MDCDGLATAERALATVDGVEELRRNPTARSLLVRYDRDALDPSDLVAALERAGVSLLSSVGAAAGEPEPLGESIARLFSRADRRVAETSGGTADLRTLVPISFAVLAARQILSGQLGSIPGYVLLWYAFDSFMKLRRPDPETDRSHD